MRGWLHGLGDEEIYLKPRSGWDNGDLNLAYMWCGYRLGSELIWQGMWKY